MSTTDNCTPYLELLIPPPFAHQPSRLIRGVLVYQTPTVTKFTRVAAYIITIQYDKVTPRPRLGLVFTYSMRLDSTPHSQPTLPSFLVASLQPQHQQQGSLKSS